ncbi:MAG TPA: hypothetical protein VMV81_13715 [Phycisphaerae bacterium]|nr:hypothetical protein [Phycisphaerae bacterium]
MKVEFVDGRGQVLVAEGSRGQGVEGKEAGRGATDEYVLRRN